MSDLVNGHVYMLHFSEPVGGDSTRGKAQHYVGWTNRDPQDRLDYHIKGFGSPLVEEAVKQGVHIDMVWAIPGTKNDERAIKDSKNARAFCPICRPEYLAAKKRRRALAEGSQEPLEASSGAAAGKDPISVPEPSRAVRSDAVSLLSRVAANTRCRDKLRAALTSEGIPA